MKRLLENALIFGRLMEVNAPHLIDRYNKALKAFGHRPTALTRFSIDMTGFSPEVAGEFDDEQYLDPSGVNRRFILLSPEQEMLPVVHTQFSNTAGLMHEFFDANRRAIHAVTIKDALYGEIEDQVETISNMDALLSIETVRFRVLSAEDLLTKAAELRTLTDRLVTSDDGWRDDAMLNRMVDLARETGDIRQNNLVPDQLVFPHNSFWTSHFGGTYVFRDGRTITVIADPAAPGFRRSRPWEVSYIERGDHRRIFEFLLKSGRLQTPRTSWVQPSGLFEHRGEMAITDLIRRSDPETDYNRIDRIWLQTFIQRNARLIEEDGNWPFLNAALREVMTTGEVNLREAGAERALMLCRAAPDHPDQWLVNRLLARYAPFDFVTRFVFDKQGFYESYETYDDNFRAHVVETLRRTYLSDKAALRKRLFGVEGARDNA